MQVRLRATRLSLARCAAASPSRWPGTGRALGAHRQRRPTAARGNSACAAKPTLTQPASPQVGPLRMMLDSSIRPGSHQQAVSPGGGNQAQHHSQNQEQEVHRTTPHQRTTNDQFRSGRPRQKCAAGLGSEINKRQNFCNPAAWAGRHLKARSLLVLCVFGDRRQCLRRLLTVS